MYLVTVTPVILNVAIESIPKKQKANNVILLNAYKKYCIGCSRKGKLYELKTHAEAPNVQGTKLIIKMVIVYMIRPKTPSYPTISNGSR
jgi:hypothetical protein